MALDAVGGPDFAFGRDGIAVSPPSEADSASITTILPQTDGSLVVGGNLVTFAPRSFEPSSSVAVAMRFSAAGEAQELGEISMGTTIETRLADLIPQGDGFVAVGGLTDFWTGQYSGFLARFSGSAFPYDSSFGGGTGLVRLGPFSDSEGEVAFRSAAADESGLIAVGYKGSRILLAHYHADGTLDTSFGEGGLADPPMPRAEYRSAEATAIVVQPDGKLVVGGMVSVPRTTFCNAKAAACWLPFLARFQPNGQLDQGFGEAGFVFSAARRTPTDGRFGLALQPDGKVLFSHGDSNLGVARYNADGSIDTSFGEDGEASVFPCQGTIAQRRRSGCLSTAAVDLKAHGLSSGRPMSQFSIRASNPLDPLAAIKLLLPEELEGRRGTAGKIRVLTVPRHRVRTKVRPGVVSVTRLGNARGIHVAIRSGVLKRIVPVATARRVLFRVEVKFKDGTSKLFGFRSPG